MSTRRYVSVPVSTLWTSPTAPRDVDGAAVSAQPDVVAWLADLDAAEARLGLHGRVLTQLELGEPVDVINSAVTGSDVTDHVVAVGDVSNGPDRGRWLQIVAPMQPSSLDTRGYPGWLPASHVSADIPDASPPQRAGDSLPAAGDSGGAATTTGDLIDVARTFLGLPYLWGGLCDAGLDCSGLVHLSLRRLGVVFPRDADDQYDLCERVCAADARPGDLFFFAEPGKRPHHVGIVTGAGRMLHAPATGATIIEEELTPARQLTLIGAGRLSSLMAHSGPTG